MYSLRRRIRTGRGPRVKVEERARNFQKAFPTYCPLVVHNGRIYGFWLIGQYYHSKSSYYGSYPSGYLSRIRSLFPDCTRVLHLFSGSINEVGLGEMTFDISDKFAPMVQDDVSNLLKHFGPGDFDLIIADPPYEAKDFERYGQKPFNKRQVIKDCSGIVTPTGFLVWLDVIFPQFSKEHWQLFGCIGLVQSTNHRTRQITIFQKLFEEGD